MNLVAKWCQLCTAELSLRVSLLSKGIFLVCEIVARERKKVEGKPYPGLLPSRIGKILEALVRRLYAVLEWVRQYRSTAEVLPEVVGLTVSSSNLGELVCTSCYKESRLITLCRLGLSTSWSETHQFKKTDTVASTYSTFKTELLFAMFLT